MDVQAAPHVPFGLTKRPPRAFEDFPKGAIEGDRVHIPGGKTWIYSGERWMNTEEFNAYVEDLKCIEYRKVHVSVQTIGQFCVTGSYMLSGVAPKVGTRAGDLHYSISTERWYQACRTDDPTTRFPLRWKSFNPNMSDSDDYHGAINLLLQEVHALKKVMARRQAKEYYGVTAPVIPDCYGDF